MHQGRKGYILQGINPHRRRFDLWRAAPRIPAIPKARWLTRNRDSEPWDLGQTKVPQPAVPPTRAASGASGRDPSVSAAVAFQSSHIQNLPAPCSRRWQKPLCWYDQKLHVQQTFRCFSLSADMGWNFNERLIIDFWYVNPYFFWGQVENDRIPHPRQLFLFL